MWYFESWILSNLFSLYIYVYIYSTYLFNFLNAHNDCKIIKLIHSILSLILIDQFHTHKRLKIVVNLRLEYLCDHGIIGFLFVCLFKGLINCFHTL